jgi:hypothetical protein
MERRSQSFRSAQAARCFAFSVSRVTFAGPRHRSSSAAPGNRSGRSSSDAVCVTVQCCSVAGQLLGMVVDRFPQSVVGDADFCPEDRVIPQDAKLFKIGGKVGRVGLLAPLAFLLLLIGFRRGSVFGLGHPATKAFSRSPYKLSIRCGATRRHGPSRVWRSRRDSKRQSGFALGSYLMPTTGSLSRIKPTWQSSWLSIRVGLNVGRL